MFELELVFKLPFGMSESKRPAPRRDVVEMLVTYVITYGAVQVKFWEKKPKKRTQDCNVLAEYITIKCATDSIVNNSQAYFDVVEFDPVSLVYSKERVGMQLRDGVWHYVFKGRRKKEELVAKDLGLKCSLT